MHFARNLMRKARFFAAQNIAAARQKKPGATPAQGGCGAGRRAMSCGAGYLCVALTTVAAAIAASKLAKRVSSWRVRRCLSAAGKKA